MTSPAGTTSTRIPNLVRWLGGALSLVLGLFAMVLWTAPVALWGATASVMLGVWALSSLVEQLAGRVTVPDKVAWWAREAWPYVASAALVAWATWPILLGQVPFTQDHAHHYLQTSVLVDDLIPSGHIFGWTERIGGGIPFGDVYGTGAYLVTGFLRIITFGAVSRATSYTFGIVVVWTIPAWALVAWTRRLLAGLVTRRLVIDLAALAAAAAFTLDIGGDREGGWVYSMFHAVWPQVLATGMWLFALVAMVRLLESTTLRRLAVATLVTGFAFWAHPMNILNMLLTAPLLFAVAAFSATERGETEPGREAGAVWWLVPAFALAGIVGFAWVSHMMAASDDLLSFSAFGRPMQEYAEQLLRTGSPFDNGHAVVGILALVGAFVAARRGGAARLFTVAGLVLFVVLSSTDLFASADFGLSDAAPFVMFKRFVITAKPLFFALAGVGLGVGLQAMLDARRRTASVYVTALLIIVAAPAVWSAAEALPGLVRMPASRILTVDDSRLGAQLLEITKRLNIEQGSAPGPKRVMIEYERGDVGDYELFVVAEAEMGYLPNRGSPAHAYRDFNVVADRELAVQLGASHVLTRSETKPPDTKLVAEALPFKLYRLNEKPRDAVWVADGNAFVQTVSWEPMHREVSVQNIKKGEAIIFGFPRYHKWSFTQDGRELKAVEFSAQGSRLTKVFGARDGTVVATYEDTTIEHVAFALFLVVLALSLLGLTLGKARPLPPIPAWFAGRSAPIASVAIVVIVGGVVVWARVAAADGLDEEWAPEPDESVISVLHRGEVTYDFAPRPYCVRPMSRNPRAECDESLLEPRLRLGRTRGKKIPACLALTVPDNGFIEFRFDVPPNTAFLRGDLEGRIAGLKTFIDVADKKERVRSSRIDLEVDGADGVSVRFENNSLRSKDLCMRLVAVGAD